MPSVASRMQDGLENSCRVSLRTRHDVAAKESFWNAGTSSRCTNAPHCAPGEGEEKTFRHPGVWATDEVRLAGDLGRSTIPHHSITPLQRSRPCSRRSGSSLYTRESRLGRHVTWSFPGVHKDRHDATFFPQLICSHPPPHFFPKGPLQLRL